MSRTLRSCRSPSPCNVVSKMSLPVTCFRALVRLPPWELCKSTCFQKRKNARRPRSAPSKEKIQFRTKAWKRKTAILGIGCGWRGSTEGQVRLLRSRIEHPGSRSRRPKPTTNETCSRRGPGVAACHCNAVTQPQTSLHSVAGSNTRAPGRGARNRPRVKCVPAGATPFSAHQ
jgi:hypothetical protein